MSSFVIIIGSIASLVSIIENWKSKRKTPSEYVIAEGDMFIGEELGIEAPEEEPSEASIILSKVIPEDILKAILNNINKAKERFIKAINNPSCNTQCEDQEHEIASATICGELERIKRLNNQQLPEDIKELWISFQCE